MAEITQLLESINAGDARAADAIRPPGALDEAEPQGVDLVQRLEGAAGIPPAGRQRVEFRDLSGVDVVNRPGTETFNFTGAAGVAKQVAGRILDEGLPEPMRMR